MSNFVSNEDAQALMQAIEGKKLTVADTMPAASPELVDKVRLYVGPDITGSYTKGVTYQCQALEVTPTGSENPQSEGWYIYNSVDDVYELTTDTTVVAGTTYYTIEWVGISSAEIDLSLYKTIWGGTKEGWDQLSQAEQDQYDYAAFEDDATDYTAVVDAVTDGDMHPVTSNAVHGAIEEVKESFTPIKLWENSELDAPGNLSYFDAQKISIPTISQYKFIKIFFSIYDRTQLRSTTFLNKNNFSGVLSTARNSTSTNYFVINYSRMFTINSDGITFENCLEGHLNAASNSNAYQIPLQIWGSNVPF